MRNVITISNILMYKCIAIVRVKIKMNVESIVRLGTQFGEYKKYCVKVKRVM